MKKRLWSLLLSLVMVLSLVPAAVYADAENTPPAVCCDSDHEMGEDDAPNRVSSGRRLMAAQNAAEKSLSCAGFITNERNQAYIDRMIGWYLSNEPALEQTLAKGQPVILFFEGGSDNVDDPRYADIKYRDGAVAIVVRRDDSGQTYICDYCENCNTLPDFPFGYEYDNDHTGYGSATLIDGVYKLYTFNHKGTHAGFNTRTLSGQGFVPCVYMRDDGTFALLNGTGINVHTRMRNTVGDSVYSPTSAGCITVGDDASLREYNEFITAAVADRFALVPTTYGEADTYLYASGSQVQAGMMVMDRFLAKDHLLSVYGGNSEAVEYITAHSAACQYDTEHMLADAVTYPSYLTLSVSDGAAVKQLPMDSAETLGIAEPALTATALYDTGAGGFWYRVRFENGTGYLPASAVTDTAAKYDDLSLHNANWPTEKTYGNAFSVTGILGAVYNRYTSVAGRITDTSGQVESSASHIVGSGEAPLFTYSINGSDGANPYSSTLDYNLGFSGLALGRHHYQLIGTVKNYFVRDGSLTWEEKTVTMLDKSFAVVQPAIVKGAESKWTQGSTSRLTFATNINSNRFTGVKVDGQSLGTSAYTSDGGSPVSVTLLTGELAALTPGQHTLTVTGKYGNADAVFYVICKQHAWDGGKVTKSATYTTEGSKIYTCTCCGATKTETIPKLTPTAPKTPVISISKADGKIKLSWNAVEGANKYWIYRSTDGVNFKHYDTTTKTSYTNSSVTSGTKYYYKVKAIKTVDGKDYIGSFSNMKSTIPLTTPALSISKTAGKIKLSWGSVTGATKYWIYRSTDGVNFKYYDTTTKTSYTNSSVTSGTRYYYKVRAVKTVNGTDWTSSYSAVKSTIPLTTPTLSAKLSSGKVYLNWSAVKGATKYWIYRSTDGVNFKYYDTTTKTSYTNSSVTAGKTYSYKVRAVKTVNGTDWTGDYSNKVSVKR